MWHLCQWCQEFLNWNLVTWFVVQWWDTMLVRIMGVLNQEKRVMPSTTSQLKADFSRLQNNWPICFLIDWLFDRNFHLLWVPYLLLFYRNAFQICLDCHCCFSHVQDTIYSFIYGWLVFVDNQITEYMLDVCWQCCSYTHHLSNRQRNNVSLPGGKNCSMHAHCKLTNLLYTVNFVPERLPLSFCWLSKITGFVF